MTRIWIDRPARRHRRSSVRARPRTRLLGPDRHQDGEQILRRDLVDRLLAERAGIDVERHPPLRAMLAVRQPGDFGAWGSCQGRRRDARSAERRDFSPIFLILARADAMRRDVRLWGEISPKWRRGGDSNPRDRSPSLPHFECGAIDHSATSPGRTPLRDPIGVEEPEESAAGAGSGLLSDAAPRGKDDFGWPESPGMLPDALPWLTGGDDTASIGES